MADEVRYWLGLTIKPGCNWGLQLLASYDMRPTDFDNSGLSFGAGLMFQPSAACSEPAGVQVR